MPWASDKFDSWSIAKFSEKIYHIFRNICQIFRKNGKFRPKNLRDVHPNAWFAQQPFVLKAILRPTLFRHRISFRICRTWLLCCQPLFRGQPWQLRKGLIRHACCRRWQARTSPPACSMVSIMIWRLLIGTIGLKSARVVTVKTLPLWVHKDLTRAPASPGVRFRAIHMRLPAQWFNSNNTIIISHKTTIIVLVVVRTFLEDTIPTHHE